jgi:hypothetical protein
MSEFISEERRRSSKALEGVKLALPRGPGSTAGRPLDSGTRAAMEWKFGHDFGSVRVHDYPQASESARALNALAYTAGEDIFFRAGRYKDGTPEGRSLIAHELAHVVQQSAGNPGEDTDLQDPRRAETEALDAARAVADQGHLPRLSQTGRVVMRAEAPQEVLKSTLGGIPTSKADVINSIKAMVASKFKGDYKAAFDHYKGKDGTIDKAGVVQVLKDAGVSGVPIIGPSLDGIASQIVATLDTNHDGKIEWEEFNAVLGK